MAYSLPPVRNIVRVTETSAVPSPSRPSELSKVSTTSARPSGARVAVPAKMTSAMLPPRRVRAPCSPSTQAMASTTLDLPDPFGPTTHVIPGSRRSVVAEANDLNPRRVSEDRYTRWRLTGSGVPGGQVRWRRGRGWQAGHRNELRLVQASRTIAVPQRRHGRPSWP